jgi:hypothetical protein
LVYLLKAFLIVKKLIILYHYQKTTKMKRIILFLIIGIVAIQNIFGQYGNFRKYQIAETGYYCYLPADPGQFSKQQSEDGQIMYLAEVKVNQVTFGIIAVLLSNDFEGNSAQELKDLLVSYMDFLKQSFEIGGTVGYGYGHTLESNPKAQGILDYWENKDGEEQVVKGWIDNTAIAFLYIKGKELPNQNVQSLFLNGFVFKK